MKVRGLMGCGLLLLLAHVALAEALRVDAMRLEPEARWRRGEPAREREDGAYLLEWPLSAGARDVALQVAIPRQTTPLKTDAEAFYANLRKKWAYQYGKRAEIGAIEIAGARWLACRRPAGEGDAIVFLLASARAGRAYSVLAFAAPHATGLPKPVYDLLAGADFAAPARPWAVRQVVAARPGREALEALMLADAENLGRDGMLTGYGIQYVEPSDKGANGPGLRLNWFLEGFQWRNRAGRDARSPFNRRGHLEVSAPATAAPSVLARLAAESNTAVEAEVGLLDLCAPAIELDAALARLATGDREPLARLARERPAACPPSPPPRLLRAAPGQSTVETLAFPMAPAPSLAAGLSRLGVVYVRPRLAGDEADLGQSLLRESGLYFVYAQE